MPLKWRIKNQDGRYCLFLEDDAGTIIFSNNKDMASVFVGTRDYVDGICKGLSIGLQEKFTPDKLE